MAEKYFVARGSERDGPFTAEELTDDRITPDTLVWTRGMSEWTQARDVPNVAAVVSLPPSVPPATASVRSNCAALTADNASSISPDEDFVLCNPRLPRMVQLICVYGLVANPLIWLITQCLWLGSIDPTDHSPGEDVSKGLALLATLTSGTAMILMLTGAMKLRSLKRSGLWLLNIGLWTDILPTVMLCVTQIAVVLYNPTVIRPPDRSAVNVLQHIVSAVLLFQIGVEVTFLVWLWRHRKRLPLK